MVHAIAHFLTSCKAVLVLNGTHVFDSDWRFDNLLGSIDQNQISLRSRMKKK